MEIAITKYEPWMESQVCDLFALNYDIDSTDFRRFFRAFYEEEFQMERNVRLAALDGKKVVGFQSFFYWPVQHDGRHVNAYQSGNSLVHPDYRGMRIFGRLLKYGDEVLDEKEAELLIGFPVDASLGSFVRKGWNADVKLQWWIKPMGLLNFFRRRKNDAEEVHDKEVKNTSSGITSDWSQAFIKWRKGYHNVTYYQLSVAYQNESLTLIVKPSVRARYIQELIIGEVYCSTEDATACAALWKQVRKELQKKFKGYHMLSFACNANSDRAIDRAMISGGLIRIRKQIHCVFRSLSDDLQLPDTHKWYFYRGDIDTW